MSRYRLTLTAALALSTLGGAARADAPPPPKRVYDSYVRAFTDMAMRQLLLVERARITDKDPAQLAVVSLDTRLESLLVQMTDEHVSSLATNDPLLGLRAGVEANPAAVMFGRYPPKGAAAYDRLPPFFRKRSDDKYTALHAIRREAYDRQAQRGLVPPGRFPANVDEWVRSLSLVDYWDRLVDPVDKKMEELLRTDPKGAALEQVIRDYAHMREEADGIVLKWLRIVPGSAQFKRLAADQAQYVREQERIERLLGLEENSDELKALPENVRQEFKDVRGVTTISNRRALELSMRRRGSVFYTEHPESYQPVIDFIQSPAMRSIRRAPPGPQR